MSKIIRELEVVILCGGRGTRLAEETKVIPKPLVKIGNKAIISHIMSHYKKYNLNNFILATGYKGNIIKDKFKNNKNIRCHNTGLNTLTGGRIKRLKNIIKNDFFLMTYGDGLCSVNIKKLINFHKSHKKIATITAVRPPARFGRVILNNNIVTSFEEKNQLNEGWINGGFFIFNREIFDYIENDKTSLEQEPLEALSKAKELIAFKHSGFWQCMDTIRDRDYLRELFREKKYVFKK